MSKTTNDIDNVSAKPIVNTNDYFGIEKSDLVTLFDKCGRNECFDEDIKEIIKLGGTEGILKKVRTRFDVGLLQLLCRCLLEGIHLQVISYLVQL